MKGLQELISKIHSDEGTRAKFMADPESVISEYQVTEPEKKALLSTHIKLGLVNSNDEKIDPVVGPMGAWA
jgi:hypothetical protein